MRTPLPFQFDLNRASPTLALDGSSWLAGMRQPLFSLVVDGRTFDAASLTALPRRTAHPAPGVQATIFPFAGENFVVDWELRSYDGMALVEVRPLLRWTGATPGTLTRIDSLTLHLVPGAHELFTFRGGWGNEFSPEDRPLPEDGLVMEADAGRSSKVFHPWFDLRRADGEHLSGAIAWSGNWEFTFLPMESGWRLSAGLLAREFSHTLKNGDVFEAPWMVLVLGRSLNEVSQQYARVGRRHWYPQNEFAATMPIEWNHWWPYEDAEINEQVFLENVEHAAPLGVDVCTLDAGWFGPSDAGTFWEHYRGDWDLVNDDRFPNGLRFLADRTHALGMRFGIWCEIEGLGEKARVAVDHPDFVATRAGQRLGGVCFGNPAVQEWAYQTLRRLIVNAGADWIKLDYNLDFGLGCDRADHGHQPGDGLVAHVNGFYRVVERLRRDFPAVVLENCSSGGLRIDLGTLRRLDMTFLSDPDYPVHDLQIFWGASTMLAAERLLHWSFCEWRHDPPYPPQTFNPRDPNLTRHQFDYYTRISMLGGYGISQKLPLLPDWVRERYKVHHRLYREVVSGFVREADLYRLSPQPRRSLESSRANAGDGLCAFQYAMPSGEAHLLFVFRLAGPASTTQVRLEGMDAGARYLVDGLEGEYRAEHTGQELMQTGLSFASLKEEDSALLRVTRLE
jgi:alpha-galactosidase